MARKVRIQYAGAKYHVINRGNFRSWIFESEGARKSFLKCLEQACLAMDWRLHAWCLMGNHYHLCLETVSPNLVEGMRWLQSIPLSGTNRFNRFRGVNGHVFQGRYKAILLDGDALGPVCHYIHLNPVRAGLVEASKIEEYSESSFAHLWRPRRRKSFEVFATALNAAGGLADTPAGRRGYRDYLEWLSAEEGERKKLGFEKMSRGWAKGSKAFKKEVLKNLADEDERTIVESEAAEIREPAWEMALKDGLSILNQRREELKTTAKGIGCKIALARYLRERHLAPHRWIAQNLHMGAPSYVQSLVSRHRSRQDCPYWNLLKKHEKLD